MEGWADVFSAASEGVSPACPVTLNRNLAQIVRGKPIKNNVFKSLLIQDKLPKITPMTVDSGACDSIVPPHLFPNTKRIMGGQSPFQWINNIIVNPSAICLPSR